MKKIHNKITITDKSQEIVFSGIVEDGKYDHLKKIYPELRGYFWDIRKNIYGKKKEGLKKYQAVFGACGTGICTMRDF